MTNLLGDSVEDVKSSVEREIFEDQTYTYPEWSSDMLYTAFNLPFSDILIVFFLAFLIVTLAYAGSFFMIVIVLFLAVLLFIVKRILISKYPKRYLSNFFWKHFGMFSSIDPFECPPDGKLKKVDIHYRYNKR